MQARAGVQRAAVLELGAAVVALALLIAFNATRITVEERRREHATMQAFGLPVRTVLGIVVNRFNICLVAFNWHLPASERYFPHWMEIGITLFVVTIGVLVYRFIVTHMPILYEHPDFKEDH